MTQDLITNKAFILAAGFGTRLRPYTDHVPKPMVQVNGRSLIYRTLDKLRSVGINDVVVNAHYLPDVLKQHLDVYCAQHDDMSITFIHEKDILDTGGGIVNALPHFKGAPFYVIAGDNLWTDADVSALKRLSDAWDDQTMDILTLMMPIDRMVLTHGVGDYDILPDGRVKRSPSKDGDAMWTNIRLNHPRIYDNAPEGAFSFLQIMDAVQEAGRFYALHHDGDWHHISTPADLEAVDKVFREQDA